MNAMALAPFILVLAAIRVHVDGATLAGYVPHITTRDLGGKITTSTFVLEQPRCNFLDVQDEDKIWLLVARSSAINEVTLPEAPENLSYQSFSNKSYYMTLNTPAVNYPCATPDEITVLRVGTETSCTNDTSKPNCNGPLPDPGPFRVQFIGIRSDKTMYRSRWSEDITLIQGRDYTANTWPRKRSGGMIAIATILPILFAILLASFIAALCYKHSDTCGNANISSVQNAATVTHYTTHHMYNHPTSKS